MRANVKFVFKFILALALAGCATGDRTPLPGQQRAMETIWYTAFNETIPSPDIYWRRDVCNEPNGKYGTTPWCTFDDAGVKVAGVHHGGRVGWVEVGAPSDGFTFSDTTLAHELLHASLGGDDGHTSPAWQFINGINEALKAEGL